MAGAMSLGALIFLPFIVSAKPRADDAA
jgi:hypothetical protein